VKALPPLVFGVNDAYCLPLVVAWQSLVESNPDLVPELEIWVLCEDLGAEARGRLRHHARRLGLDVLIHRVELPDLAYNTSFGGARANYLRLAIPEVLGDRERVLYLDADIVLRADLEPLLRRDLGGLALAAAVDQVNPTVGAGRGLTGWRELAIPADREYFNSGVLLIDLPRAQREGVFARAFEAVRTHPEKLRLWDQDALNVAAADRWLRLERRWNSAPLPALVRTPWFRAVGADFGPSADLVRQQAEAAVLHYLSPAKPWKSLLPAGDANDLYQRLLRQVVAAESEDVVAVRGGTDVV
jgi:lipopolysaccharide biosynthesis glycosyltransferase